MPYEQVKNPVRSGQAALSFPGWGYTRIGLNQILGGHVLEDKSLSVEVLVDKDALKIAIRFHAALKPGNFPLSYPPIKRQNRASSVTFNAWTLLQKLGWKSKTRVQILLVWNPLEGFWEGDLPQEFVTFVPLTRKGRDVHPGHWRNKRAKREQAQAEDQAQQPKRKKSPKKLEVPPLPM